MRVAMISGARRGIGRAIAEHLAAEGWSLSLGLRDHSTGIGNDLDGTPLAVSETVLHCPYEATDPMAAQAWVDTTLARFGQLDALIDCAGILRRVAVDGALTGADLAAEEADLDALLATNVKGPWRLSRAAFPALTRSGHGRIIMLVSMSGKRVRGRLAGYGMSKFAQLALCQALRNLGWEHGVRVTAICPGFVQTEMSQEITDMDPALMTQPPDLARLVSMVLGLPNTAAVPEIMVQSQLETMA